MVLKCSQGLTCLHGRPEWGGRAAVMAWDMVPSVEVRFPTTRKRLLSSKTKILTKHSGLQSHRLLGLEGQVSLGRVEQFLGVLGCGVGFYGRFPLLS